MRRYSGNSITTMSNGQGIRKLVELCRRRWETSCLGIYAARDKRGKPGDLSVHALWRATDLTFPTPLVKEEALNWLSSPKVAEALKIDLIVDYAYTKRDKLGRKAFGRAWRCDRGKWRNLKEGEVTNGGQPWANWVHIELGGKYAVTENAKYFETTWRALPKP